MHTTTTTIMTILALDITPVDISCAHCSCQAGVCGTCSHVVGLIIALQQWQMLGFTDVPSQLSCTSLPEQWSIPRGQNIDPVAVPHMTFVNPKLERKKKPITNTLSDCRSDSEDEAVLGEMFLQEKVSEDEGVTIVEPSVRDTRLRFQVLTTLHDSFASMFKDEELTDLNVKVEGHVYKCHRVILAAMSRYFRSLMSSGMRESQNGDLDLKEISRATFDAILLYVYYGENIIRGDTVEDLLKASIFLQMKALERECVQFLSNDLNPNNCIGIWTLGKRFNCPSLIEKAWTIIVRHFEEVSRLDEFMSLEKDDLMAILDDEQLNQDTEDTICGAVLCWVRSDLESREGHLDDILQLVCLPKVSGPFLYDRLVQSSDLMSRNVTFRNSVMDALAYHLKPDEKASVMVKQAKLRNDPNFQKVVTLIGGYFAADDPLRCFLCFDLKRQRWYTTATIPHEPGEDFATCVFQNEIYLSGGSRALDKFVKYNPGINVWIAQPALITGRECHSMVEVDYQLYVLGGRNSQRANAAGPVVDIEAYNTRSGQWAKAGTIQLPLESFTAAVVKKKIYTFGGMEEGGQTSSAIQCFDPATGTCTLVASLPDPACMTESLVLGSDIFVFNPEGVVYRFDEAHTITEFASFDARSKFGLYTDGKSLVIVGGEKENGDLLDDILNIDVKSGRVAPSGNSLKIPFCGFTMETIVVPRQMLVQQGFNVQGQNLFDPELESRMQKKHPYKHYN